MRVLIIIFLLLFSFSYSEDKMIIEDIYNEEGEIIESTQKIIYIDTGIISKREEIYNFNFFKWLDPKSKVLSSEKSKLVTNLIFQSNVYESYIFENKLEYFDLELKKFNGTLNIFYVFRYNKLVTGYYIFLLNEGENLNNYEKLFDKINTILENRYGRMNFYSPNLLNPPYGNYEGTLKYSRWETMVTTIELYLERDKYIGVNPPIKKNFIITLIYYYK